MRKHIRQSVDRKGGAKSPGAMGQSGNQGWASPRPGRAPIAFAIKFGGLLLLLGVADYSSPGWHFPIARRMVPVVAAGLSAIGCPAQGHDDQVVFSGGQVRVVAECTGVHLVAIALAFGMAMPMRWRRRVLGFLGLTAVLVLANFLRLISAVLLLRWAPRSFPLVHGYVWQVALLGLCMGGCVLWARSRVPSRGPSCP